MLSSASSLVLVLALALAPTNSLIITYQLRYTFYICYAYALGQDLSMHAKILTPVTLTMTIESAFSFRNLRLGFEN